MNWTWPQITWVVLTFLSLLITVIAAFLLYMGGFWAGATP